MEVREDLSFIIVIIYYFHSIVCFRPSSENRDRIRIRDKASTCPTCHNSSFQENELNEVGSLDTGARPRPRRVVCVRFVVLRLVVTATTGPTPASHARPSSGGQLMPVTES